MGWPSENIVVNVRRLRRLLKRKGGRMVIPCNLTATREAVKALSDSCSIRFGDRDATIRVLTEAELQKRKRKKRKKT